MDSQIKEFYKNKTIFLTGGSGFLGRVIIEKLLRATEASRIYVLIRSKRGKSAQDRIDDWKTNPLFEVVLKTKPNVLERIVPVFGDCELPDLGISAVDQERLKKEVQVVIHCAATVNFAEPLHKAFDINTRATHLMLNLAKEISRLEGFVHVSTAFSNCVIPRISEQYYPDNLIASVDKVLQLREICGNSIFDGLAPSLMGKFPNTYTFTKAMAEQVIQTESDGLPVCIFRPGAIAATSNEPITGWMDNIYGPIAMIYGCAIGVLRVAPIADKALNHLVPVDYCANIVIASVVQTAKESAEHKRLSLPPTIYNYVPHKNSPLTNGNLHENVSKNRYVAPLEQSLWYPFLHTTSIHWMFKLICVFYHTIPGYALDLVLQLRGEKPRLMSLYKKIHKSMDALSYFSTGFWTYETTNTDRLWQSLSAADKEHFQFDMSTFDWQSFFTRALLGMRVYMAHEDPGEESLQRARDHMKRLEKRQRILQLVLCICGIFIVKWLVGLFL